MADALRTAGLPKVNASTVHRWAHGKATPRNEYQVKPVIIKATKDARKAEPRVANYYRVTTATAIDGIDNGVR